MFPALLAFLNESHPFGHAVAVEQSAAKRALNFVSAWGVDGLTSGIDQFHRNGFSLLKNEIRQDGQHRSKPLENQTLVGS